MHKYHPAQFDDVVHDGGGYIGSFHEIYCCLEIIQKAVEQVGPENFNAQALHDTATGFETVGEGYKAWSFTQTKRHAVDYLAIYGWSAQEQDMVRKLGAWVPVVIE